MSVQNRFAGRTATEIAASIEQAMHARGFADVSLPTVRALAHSLKVSPGTVASAYKLLKSKGLVSGSGRAGTRVVVSPPARAFTSRQPGVAVDLSTGGPDPALLPHLAQALRTVIPVDVMDDESPVWAPLADFARAELEADGIAAASLAVTSGALDAIDRLLREHLRTGDEVVVEDPCVPAVADLIRASGLRATPCAVDDEGLIPGALEDVLTPRRRALVVTPRAQNPFGSVVTPPRAAALRRVLRRAPGVLVIENDYAGPVSGAPAATIVDGSRQRWAVVRSVSTFLGPDFRLAMVTGDELTMTRVRRRQTLGARWVSHLLQRLAFSVWSDPAGGRRLARAAEIYSQRRRALIAALAARGIRAHGRSGLNVWIPVREEARVVGALAERGWAVASGERFRMRAAPGIRVTISTLAPSDARRFADDLGAILRPAHAGRA